MSKKPYTIIESSDADGFSLSGEKDLGDSEALCKSLVIVHAVDHLIEKLPESSRLIEKIIARIDKYLARRKKVFYLPFLQAEGVVPKYMRHLERYIEYVPVSQDTRRLYFVEEQGNHMASICKSEGLNLVEVGGLYRYACVNAVATNMTKKGLDIVVNTNITNSSHRMFASSEDVGVSTFRTSSFGAQSSRPLNPRLSSSRTGGSQPSQSILESSKKVAEILRKAQESVRSGEGRMANVQERIQSAGKRTSSVKEKTISAQERTRLAQELVWSSRERARNTQI